MVRGCAGRSAVAAAAGSCQPDTSATLLCSPGAARDRDGEMSCPRPSDCAGHDREPNPHPPCCPWTRDERRPPTAPCLEDVGAQGPPEAKNARRLRELHERRNNGRG